MTQTAQEWQERLARHENAYNEAEVAEGGMYVDPPDGDYQGTVYAFDFIDTDKHGAFLKTEIQVAAGPHEGRITSTMHSLEDPERYGFLKAHLALLGIDIENTPLRMLHPGSPVLEEVLDVPIEFTIKRSQKVNEKTGQPYVNLYVNKRLGGPMRAVGEATSPDDQQQFTHNPATPAPGEDPIPF